MNDTGTPTAPRDWELDALEESFARHRAQLPRVLRPVDRQTLQPLLSPERRLPQWPF